MNILYTLLSGKHTFENVGVTQLLATGSYKLRSRWNKNSAAVLVHT